MPEANQVALELPEETKERLAELRVLSKKAQAGDAGARGELRRMVRASSPEVIGRASDIGRKAGQTLARAASGGDPLTDEALYAKLDLTRAEIAGEDPTPLEVLLTERVVSLWMLTARSWRRSWPRSTGGARATPRSGPRPPTSSSSRGYSRAPTAATWRP